MTWGNDLTPGLQQLHPKLETALSKKYNILFKKSLVNYYFDFPKLEHDLKNIRKEVFDKDDRIIIHSSDFLYYIQGFDISIYVYNLIKCLKYVDIPGYNVIFICHQNIEKEVEKACKLLDYDTIDFKHTLCFLLHWNPEKVSISNLNQTNITHKFSCLLALERPHRNQTKDFIINNNLLDQTIYSFTRSQGFYVSSIKGESNEYQDKKLDAIETNKTSWHANFVSEIDYLTTYNQYDTVNELYNYGFENKKNMRHNLIDTVPNTPSTRYQYSVLQNAFLDIVSESTVMFPQAYITEKTFRPMNNMRPFIVFGCKGHLKQLKTLGFKTFNKWWDESYDNVDNPYTRMKTVERLILKLNEYTIKELKEMIVDMTNVLEHNKLTYNNLHKKFLEELNV